MPLLVARSRAHLLDGNCTPKFTKNQQKEPAKHERVNAATLTHVTKEQRTPCVLYSSQTVLGARGGPKAYKAVLFGLLRERGCVCCCAGPGLFHSNCTSLLSSPETSDFLTGQVGEGE